MNQELNEISDTNKDNPILDIVNTIQAKLNESNITTASETMTNNSINNSKTDLSGLDIAKMLELIAPKTKNVPNNSNNNSSGINLDLASIMNIQKSLSGLNQTDPRQNLLTSLKPFLRETRQKNIDTYITLLGVMKAFNIFTNKDRD